MIKTVLPNNLTIIFNKEKKMSLRKILAAVIMLFVCSFAQINLLSNAITFRSTSTATNSIQHYGDLILNGRYIGDPSWGWLYANASICRGWGSFDGLLTCYQGLQVYGTKNFIQPHPTDSTKVIKYISIEAGEALTIARGTSKTVGGIAHIDLPEHFSLVTSNEAPITVLLTPKKVPALLYTQEETKEKLVVGMKPSDYNEFGDAEFAWQVTGVRDGYENEEVIVDVDKFVKLEKSEDETNLSEKRKKMNEKVEKLKQKREAIFKSK